MTGPTQVVVGWNVTVGQATGASHERAGIGSQDRCGWAEIRPGVLSLSVADGAGSRVHSAMGAQFAVEAATEAAYAVFGPNTQKEATVDWPSVMAALRAGTFDRFDRMVELAVANPDLSGAVRDDFATTLSTVIITEDSLSCLSIGDGFVVACREPGSYQLIVPPPLDREGTYLTTFLTSEERDAATTRRVVLDRHIVALALSTDGLMDALLRLDTSNRIGRYFVAPPEFEDYFAFAASGVGSLSRALASPTFEASSNDDKTLLIALRV